MAAAHKENHSRGVAVHAYDGLRVYPREDIKGSIEPGKLDLAVLSATSFTSILFH
jgi:hypothetical protein